MNPYYHKPCKSNRNEAFKNKYLLNIKNVSETVLLYIPASIYLPDKSNLVFIPQFSPVFNPSLEGHRVPVLT